MGTSTYSSWRPYIGTWWWKRGRGGMLTLINMNSDDMCHHRLDDVAHPLMCQVVAIHCHRSSVGLVTWCCHVVVIVGVVLVVAVMTKWRWLWWWWCGGPCFSCEKRKEGGEVCYSPWLVWTAMTCVITVWTMWHIRWCARSSSFVCWAGDVVLPCCRHYWGGWQWLNDGCGRWWQWWRSSGHGDGGVVVVERK